MRACSKDWIVILLAAPVPIVPAAFVALFVAGTGAGFLITHRALTVATRAHADAHGTSPADDARTALAASVSDARTTYARIDAVLRRYLDARFGLDTASLPGPEIERALTCAGVTQPVARLAAHLLERCAQMRTAGALPRPERIEVDVRSAREIIDVTA